MPLMSPACPVVIIRQAALAFRTAANGMGW
jgi:hypothetical protein